MHGREIREREVGEERVGSGSSKREGSREKCEMQIILIEQRVRINFNPSTPASNCLRPTPNFQAFFGIFQSERKHKNKPYAQ